jgi:hypothetical protein
MKRIYAGRYQAGPWIIVETGHSFWTLIYKRHDGSRGESVIDNFPTLREAKEAYEREAPAYLDDMPTSDGARS